MAARDEALVGLLGDDEHGRAAHPAGAQAGKRLVRLLEPVRLDLGPHRHLRREREYLRHGGILPFVLRRLLAG